MRSVALVLTLVLTLVLAPSACTHASAPKARLAGEILALGGVGGLIGGAFVSRYLDSSAIWMGTFSLVSALGITLYAIGEQTDPMTSQRPETEAEKFRRWAKILTERAGGAAREGKCPRVRRLEKRVNLYNREVHDFVFMKDPEILRCLEEVAPPPGAPASAAVPPANEP